MFIQQLASDARLINIKASSIGRESLSKNLSRKHTYLLDKKLMEQGFVTKDDLDTFNRTIIPNVNVSIVETNSREPYVDTIIDENTNKVLGLEVGLHFDEDMRIYSNDKEKRKDIIHEIKHVHNIVAKPKYFETMLIMLPKKKDIQQCKFYDKFLYAHDLDNVFVLKRLKLSKNDPQRVNILTDKIEKFFKKKSFTQEEKITTLQQWKYGLKNELSAFDEAIQDALAHNKEISKNAADVKTAQINSFLANKEYDEVINKDYFFPQKIKIVESMLAKEMDLARKEMAKTRTMGKVDNSPKLLRTA